MTGVQRTIECLAREVAQVEADKQRFEARCETLEAMVGQMEADRGVHLAIASHWRTEAERLQTRLNELETPACANYACQLHQMETR